MLCCKIYGRMGCAFFKGMAAVTIQHIITTSRHDHDAVAMYDSLTLTSFGVHDSPLRDPP